MNLISFFLLCLLSFEVLGALTQDEEKKYDELEGLPFFKALILDKKFEEAIRQYPGLTKNESQLMEYHYFLAEAHFSLKHFKKAYEVLESGAKLKTPTVNYYKLWARSAVKTSQFKECSGLYSKIDAKEISGQDWITYSHCLVKSDQSERLLALILNHKSQDLDFFLVSQKYLIKNGLHSIAAEKRNKFLESCREAEAYTKLWDITSELQVLEIGHACLPEAMEITSLMIKSLFAEGKYHSVAYLFDQLSATEAEYLKHAAEFYKVAGRITVADYFFILGDENGYLLARSSKFLNEENYAGLLTIPFRPKLLKVNKDLAYAVAYSHFKYLSLDSSHEMLSTQAKVNNRDEQLKGLIEQCRELDWKCRP